MDFTAGLMIIIVIIALPFIFIPRCAFVFGMLGKLLRAGFDASRTTTRVHDPESHPTVALTCPYLDCGFAAGYPPEACEPEVSQMPERVRSSPLTVKHVAKGSEAGA